MADFTTEGLINRFQAVMEAAPLSMVLTREPFSHDRQPAGLVQNTYRIEDAGLASSRPASNHAQVRVDNFKVWFARKIAFAGQTALEAAEATIVVIERAILVDGRAQGYHPVLTGRDPRRFGDLVIVAVSFDVDYDFSEV
jgi:hypothetical protein